MLDEDSKKLDELDELELDNDELLWLLLLDEDDEKLDDMFMPALGFGEIQSTISEFKHHGYQLFLSSSNT
jgi:hypothetical protein